MKKKRPEDRELYRLPNPLRDNNKQQPYQIKIYTEKEEGTGLNRLSEEASLDYQEDEKNEKKERTDQIRDLLKTTDNYLKEKNDK